MPKLGQALSLRHGGSAPQEATGVPWLAVVLPLLCNLTHTAAAKNTMQKLHLRSRSNLTFSNALATAQTTQAIYEGSPSTHGMSAAISLPARGVLMMLFVVYMYVRSMCSSRSSHVVFGGIKLTKKCQQGHICSLCVCFVEM